jgi:hypothetical protein
LSSSSGSLVEQRHQAHALERGEDRRAVAFVVERPVRRLAEAARRDVAVQAEHQARAARPRLRQVGDVAAVQDVEHPVGEDDRPRQLGEARLELGARAELGDEGGEHARIVAAAPP